MDDDDDDKDTADIVDASRRPAAIARAESRTRRVVTQRAPEPSDAANADANATARPRRRRDPPRRTSPRVVVVVVDAVDAVPIALALAIARGRRGVTMRDTFWSFSLERASLRLRRPTARSLDRSGADAREGRALARTTRRLRRRLLRRGSIGNGERVGNVARSA
jgi:hypothetical protein